MVSRWGYIFRKILSRRENWIFIPVIIIIFLLLFYSIYAVYLTTPSQPQLSIYSNSWQDLSECRQGILESGYKVSSIISTPAILSKFDSETCPNKVYMSIGIQRPYTPEETLEIWNFANNGGNIILADDFGFGNSVWEGDLDFDVKKVEFELKQLFDPNYYKNTTFVMVNAILPKVNSEIYQLMLNAPTGLRKTYESDSFSVLARSSDNSWLDKNGNRIRDATEVKQSYPIITYFEFGNLDGKVIIVSDPGLFINENWQQLDNAEYVLGLIKTLLPNGGEVIFDESRHISDDTFENTRRSFYSATVFITSTMWSIVIIVFIIISFTLVIGLKIKPQIIWRNRGLLNARYYNILNYPYVTQYDFSQIYNTFLEKVRLGYGYSADEFKELDEGTLHNLISDPDLWRFVTQQFPHFADYLYFTGIVERIIAWEPLVPGMERRSNVEEYHQQYPYDDVNDSIATEVEPYHDEYSYTDQQDGIPYRDMKYQYGYHQDENYDDFDQYNYSRRR